MIWPLLAPIALRAQFCGEAIFHWHAFCVCPSQRFPRFVSRKLGLARLQGGGFRRSMAQCHGAHAGACETLASGINKTCRHCFTRKREHGLTRTVCFVRTQGCLESQGFTRRALGGKGLRVEYRGVQGFNVENLRGQWFKRRMLGGPGF